MTLQPIWMRPSSYVWTIALMSADASGITSSDKEFPVLYMGRSGNSLFTYVQHSENQPCFGCAEAMIRRVVENPHAGGGNTNIGDVMGFAAEVATNILGGKTT